MAAASPEQVDHMAGAVHHALYGPTGIAHLLPPGERQLLDDTEIVVVDQPSPEDKQLAQASPEDRLLGLFTHPPSRIQLFASDIMAAQYDVVDVAVHEIGHRMNYDHSLEEANVAMLERQGQTHHHGARIPGWLEPEAGILPMAQVETRVLNSGGDQCPVCLLHQKTAECEKLLDGLRKRSHLQHRVPDGLGGLIPLLQVRVSEAQGTLALVEGMLPDRKGQTRMLSGQLQELGDSLQGWQTPESVSQAHALAYKAWDSSFDISHAAFLRRPPRS